MTDHEKELTAYHEAGHAIMALYNRLKVKFTTQGISISYIFYLDSHTLYNSKLV